jgi:WD40 repeat protein
MHLCCRLSLLSVMLLLPSPLDAGETPAVRTDRHGDPLPAGAIARLGTVRLRHGTDIDALAFAPDGKTLASASRDGQLSLWDATSGKELHHIQGDPRRGISLLAFSPSGKLLAFTERSSKWLIHLCDPVTGKVIHKLAAGEGPVHTLAFSPDGRLLAWAGRHEPGHLWDVTAGKEAGRLDGLGKSVTFLAFMPDGKALIAGTEEDETAAIRVWDLAARKETHQFQVNPWDLQRGALSPDGTFVAFMDNRGLFLLRDLTRGKRIRRIGQRSRGLPCPMVHIHLSPDGKILAAVGPDSSPGHWEGMVRLWDIATGKEVGWLQGPWGGRVTPGCAAFSPDSRVLTVAGLDHAVHLFDLATGKERPQDGGLLGDVGRVAISPDAKRLATASWDGIHLWDTAGREIVRLPTPHAKSQEGVSALAFTEDGKRLVAAGSSGTVQVWDVATARELRHRKGPEGNWWAIGLSPNAEVLALGGADEQWLVGQDVATGTARWRLDYSQERISSLALSPQGQTVAVAVDYGVIHFWDLKARELRHRIPGKEPASNGPCHARLAFSPDGKTLVSQRSKDGVQLWEVATGQERLRLKDLPVEVSSIALAADGRLLAWGAEDGTVGLWDLATGERLYQGRGHRGLVDHLSFSVNGKLLFSGSADTTALLWDVLRLVLPQRADK